MPIENIKIEEKQERLFEEKLIKILNPNNKLCKLRELINWEELEERVLGKVDIKELGRNRKSQRGFMRNQC
jgi:hypothetical protein